MSLQYAILGFLTLSPMTGYDLKTVHFDGSVSFFWPADQAQIYRTLDKLSEAGYVTSHIEAQTERPSRKVYEITPAGLTHLQTWLETPHDLKIERRPFLLQLYFSRHISREALLAVLHHQLALHEAQLQRYRSLALPPAETDVMAEQLQFGALTLDYGLRYEQMQLDWLRATIAAVEGFAE